MHILVAAASGALFAVGLVLGGMTQTRKVIAFLDITGDFDPSLMFVMGGAIAVYAPVFRWIAKRHKPLLAPALQLPESVHIDGRLLLGSSLFGVGWGLGGFCPGPALTAAGSLLPDALLFTAMMVVGFFLARLWDAAR